MNISNIILLLTFLAYPIIAIIVSGYIRLDKVSRLIKPTFLFFLIHNILFFLGFSLSGNYVDYFIFSTEYLLFCLTINLLPKTTNIYLRTFRILGIIVISIGIFIGFMGILFFPAISQDYETDKVFRFSDNDKTYETRRYSFGTVSSVHTRFTFETYRIFNLVPIEKKIDKTHFFEFKTNLNIREPNLKISLIRIDNKRQIVFKSTNGKTFTKQLD